MNDYVELRLDITPCSETATDVMASLLADAGFESFVPDDSGLTAYVRSELFDTAAVNEAVACFPMNADVKVVSSDVVVGKDWNSEWEKNYFKPIVISDKCVIHSSFHTDVPSCRYDIVIDPKMAFGTGHHSTTSLMIENLLETVTPGCNVVDMGTGTGILAILASMAGAGKVTAIEIDGFAYENACENIRLNGVDNVTVIHGDASALAPVTDTDLFLANINRNIITADIDRYAATLRDGATVLLSGFYEADVPVIRQAAECAGLHYEGFEVKSDGWACVKLTYSAPK